MIPAIKVAIDVAHKEKAPKEEVLQMLFAKVEHIINRHPLVHVSNDYADQETLIPKHLLICCSSVVFTSGTVFNGETNIRKQWKTSEELINQFWQRWVREYLPTLTRRAKWFQKVDNIKTGDVVIIVDSSMPRNVWPKGEVVKVYQGNDGIIRVFNVLTRTGVMTCPV